MGWFVAQGRAQIFERSPNIVINVDLIPKLAGGTSEAANRFPQTARRFGNALWSQHQQCQNKDHDEFRRPKPKHRRSLRARCGAFNHRIRRESAKHCFSRARPRTV